jgi:mannose-6-phosphate isomerase-like protein (cupin superfamily)
MSNEERTTPTSLWAAGHKITPLMCAGRVVALEMTNPAGIPGPPPHHHDDCAEFFHVIAGRLELMRDGIWITLGPGEQAEIPRGTLHTFRNDGDSEVRVIHGYEPAGFEAFFLNIGIDTRQPDSNKPSEYDRLPYTRSIVLRWWPGHPGAGSDTRQP